MTNPHTDDLATAGEWLTERVLETMAGGAPIDPTALLFLLRRFAASERDDLGDVVGAALARTIDEPPAADAPDRPGWLFLYSEASLVSDDPRLAAAASRLVASLRDEWKHQTEVSRLAASVDACLAAAACLTPARLASSDDLVPAAVDQIERMVGATYRPGAGLGHSVARPEHVRGRLDDHVAVSGVLLAAYSHTGRLPYSMLAEELMQWVRLNLRDERDGGFFAERPADVAARSDGEGKPFRANCEAVRVLCRLAFLHTDLEYRTAALVSDKAGHADDARRALVSQAPQLARLGHAGAVYGVALDELLALQS